MWVPWDQELCFHYSVLLPGHYLAHRICLVFGESVNDQMDQSVNQFVYSQQLIGMWHVVGAQEVFERMNWVSEWMNLCMISRQHWCSATIGWISEWMLELTRLSLGLVPSFFIGGRPGCTTFGVCCCCSCLINSVSPSLFLFVCHQPGSVINLL